MVQYTGVCLLAFVRAFDASSSLSPNNWGPKPFRVINGWFDHPDFFSFVKQCWMGFVVHGKKAFVLKEKFRMLKECLRKWNKEVFGYMDLNIEKIVNDLNNIEGLLGGDDDVQLLAREGLTRDFWRQILKFRRAGNRCGIRCSNIVPT
ncbi:hypothetical protein QL285_097633 [Trifolium repens]|nr:hypothetical protein QL285_097633 [Trifolium repens]